MGNKTIYVSEKDEELFNHAKEIAGETLSTVIARALKEFISRHEEKEKGMKEIAVKVGRQGSESEKRFVGKKIGDWKGFSDNKEWYLGATIYLTQKNNVVVHLITISKASLLTNKDEWKMSGDFLVNSRKYELFIGKTPEELKNKIPHSLYEKITDLMEQVENPIEYLDI